MAKTTYTATIHVRVDGRDETEAAERVADLLGEVATLTGGVVESAEIERVHDTYGAIYRMLGLNFAGDDDEPDDDDGSAGPCDPDTCTACSQPDTDHDASPGH